MLKLHVHCNGHALSAPHAGMHILGLPCKAALTLWQACELAVIPQPGQRVHPHLFHVSCRQLREPHLCAPQRVRTAAGRLLPTAVQG